MGCHIGLLSIGALAYADDLVLSAPSANVMRHILQVCDDYAAQYNVLFNATNLNTAVIPSILPNME
jgi:hypothetical protein